ncbi:MAG: carbohydrate binding family 9 domain-containing protein, partial [Thermoanaerobaculia bacterium]
MSRHVPVSDGLPRLALALSLGAAGVPNLSAQPAEPPARPSVAAGLASGPIRIDGSLDEPAWGTAGVVALTEQSPHPGEATPFGTEVRILADGENLYFGLLCTDPSPDRISIHTLQRDGEMAGEDTVTIVLDTFSDRRTGYFFQVNSAGARTDGLIAGPEEQSRDWDGIWDAATHRTPAGWSAEIQIPASTLRFLGGADSWGLNVVRSVPRDLLFLRWTGI